MWLLFCTLVNFLRASATPTNVFAVRGSSFSTLNDTDEDSDGDPSSVVRWRSTAFRVLPCT